MKTASCLNTIFTACCLTLAVGTMGQNTGSPAEPDTISTAKTSKLDIFPAISFSPETKLTLGVIGIKYLDFRKKDESTPLSTLEFFTVYTTAKQLLMEARWEFFTHQKKWRTRGEAIFNHYTDRNYGLGNDAEMELVTENKKNGFDTLNYLLFMSDRIKFSPVVLRKIGEGLSLGIQTDLEYMFNYEPVPEAHHFLNSDSSLLTNLPVAGLRSGAGLQLLYDTRDFVANPLHGSLVEVNALLYPRWLGSDFRYGRFMVDARYYINLVSNHTLALRGFLSILPSDGAIPMRALSRTNGHKFVRGYYRGTYQDNHMAAFEAEYRLPFWKETATSKIWQVWKRLGVTAFMSGAKAFHDADDFDIEQFNLAVGGGLRILLNKPARVNIRIDYAFGLRENSDGPGRKQKGFYFFLSEAF